ncbi:hypothetical protein Mgra_00003367 [Meloidogyne graminicola]|uniref:Mannosyl-oligosaccharide glucosidase n=1 Tax=Meloidogyne graminicola TaxID=189291 RepID=A0A8S9ZVP6_9BILA|nr:hypothetical protein Mgra_00003367 [Meloidogyne graminicola]
MSIIKTNENQCLLISKQEEGGQLSSSSTSTTLPILVLPKNKLTKNNKIFIFCALFLFSLFLAIIILFYLIHPLINSSSSKQQQYLPFNYSNYFDLNNNLLLVNNKLIFNEDPSEKSKLPLASHPIMFNETGWSSYRPQLYFGLKNRRPDSPLFGIMWYQQQLASSSKDINLRNWAKHDNVIFMWNQHDGRSFGSQKLIDGEYNIRTDFINFKSSSFITRFYLTKNISIIEEKQKWSKQLAFIIYFALQDIYSNLIINSSIYPKDQQINLFEGKSDAVNGKFNLKINLISKNKNLKISATKLNFEPFPDMALTSDLIKQKLVKQSDGNFAFDIQNNNEEENIKTNFIALQISTEEDTAFEVLFHSENDGEPPSFTDKFKEKEEAFRANFSRAFPIEVIFNIFKIKYIFKNYSAIYHKMGHAALSNLLGGIGVWHGSCKMRSHLFSPPDSIKPYGPLSLMSAVPSRTGFPRGFIWDEGFHNMLIHKFDPLLTIQIIGSYLDMMNIDGWIPREIAIGSEAEARIPGTFLVQEDWVANPPMFFYLMRDFIGDKELFKHYGTELKRMYPRMKQLYIWLRTSQKGPKPGTFRWHDRNATTNMELNPCSLSSGLDDYPRATHPTDKEYHLDLRCWMAMSSTVVVDLAKLFGDEEFLPEIEKEAEMLNNIENLDELHWSEAKQQYCDYGLHSDSVKLVPETTPQGETILVRKVLKEPQYKFVENVNGYMNMYPLFMRLLPANSPKIGPLLKQLEDPKQFWTPYGLRSISTLSPYYFAWNSKGGSPYWRGPIWINMGIYSIKLFFSKLNYFAIAALKHYSLIDGPYKEEAARLHFKLRDNLLKNLALQYEETGFLWETYNDKNGQGEGNHPFTGWTTLILKILSNTY